MKKLERKPRFWMTVKISEDIFARFNHLIQFDEPIPPFSSRFPGKLEGILNSIKQTFAKQYLNSTVLDAAAAYFNQIIRGHPFKNGNKRIAILITHVFLLTHGLDFTLSYEGIYNFALALARFSQKLDNEQTKKICKDIIREHTREFKRTRFS
ncbi:MAG TPA: type II toxin-antitoxin system death-on-curing family toxin [Candidatus Bathyarchaeia archaeon]|nr:type II toxin-antitoxin system death-on-curing family toxin [Candidatus Bathyarchaeia archaeon]